MTGAVHRGRPVIAFDGDDIRLILSDHGSDVCLVTYTPRPVHPGRLQQGFALRFAEKRGLSGAYLVSRRAHWWQSPELAHVEAMIRDWPAFRDAPHRLGYGGSMGGFGVLLSAGRVGCNRALVSSPQTTFDPDFVTYHNRYAKDIKGLHFTEPHAWSGVRDTCQYVVVYDPLDSFDRRQVDLLAPFANIDYLAVGFSSHSPLVLLKEAGVLESVVLDQARGRLDLPAMRRRLHAAKRDCPLYHATLAGKALETGRPSLGLDAARRAFALAPNSSLVFRTLARLLRENGDLASLVEAARTFLAAGGEPRTGGDQLRNALYVLKDHDAALDVARHIAGDSDSADDRAWVVRILRQAGRLDDALAEARIALEAHPGNAALQVTLFDTLFAARDYAGARELAGDLLAHDGLTASDRKRIQDLIDHPRLASIRDREIRQTRHRLFQEGQIEEALAVAESLLSTADSDEDDMTWVVNLLNRLGRHEEGAERARAALETSPGDARLQIVLIDSLSALDRHDEAREVATAVLADPELRDTDRLRVERLLAGLAAAAEREAAQRRQALYAAGAFAEALPIAVQLAGRLGANIGDAVWEVRTLQRLGRHAEAVTRAEAGLARHGDDLRLRTSLFDSLFAGGDHARARVALDELLLRDDLVPAERSRLERLAGQMA